MRFRPPSLSLREEALHRRGGEDRAEGRIFRPRGGSNATKVILVRLTPPDPHGHPLGLPFLALFRALRYVELVDQYAAERKAADATGAAPAPKRPRLVEA